MQIADITEKKIIKVKRSLTLRELLNLFKGFHALPLIPVVDDADKLIGVVFLENLIDLLRPPQTKLFRKIPFMEIDEDSFDLEPIPSMGELIIVDDIMETNFITINAKDSLENAYKTMRLSKKDRAPVVDDANRFIGILGIFDIIWRMFKEKEVV
jgi:CBS domain-containing protein